MELSGDFPCENCKCEDTVHDKDGKNCKITYEVRESRARSHYNSYLYRRDSSPYANHYVQNPGLCDTGPVKAPYDHREGSSNINEKNALWSSFTGKMSNLFMDKLKLKNIKTSG